MRDFELDLWRVIPQATPTAAHRKSDQRRDDLCAGGLRKRAREWLAVAAG